MLPLSSAITVPAAADGTDASEADDHPAGCPCPLCGAPLALHALPEDAARQLAFVRAVETAGGHVAALLSGWRASDGALVLTYHWPVVGVMLAS